MSELIKVTPLSLGTVFKKGFSDVAIFTQMVKDFTGVNIKIKEVENEDRFYYYHPLYHVFGGDNPAQRLIVNPIRRLGGFLSQSISPL
jgi:hypothetical protein